MNLHSTYIFPISLVASLEDGIWNLQKLCCTHAYFYSSFILCWTVCHDWFMKQVSAIYVHIIVVADYVSCIGWHDFFFLCQPVMFSEVSILWFKCLVEFACLQAQLAISLLRPIIDCAARICRSACGYILDMYPVQIHIRYAVDTYPTSIRKK
jgi:hypothetical protein